MTMIVCPNCKHQELDGSLFCSECGAQLVFTTTNDNDELSVDMKEQIPAAKFKNSTTGDAKSINHREQYHVKAGW